MGPLRWNEMERNALHQRLTAAVSGALLVVTGCSASTASSTANSEPPVGATFSRMFDGQCQPNGIFVLEPPFVSEQHPAAVVAQPCGNGIAFNPNDARMAVDSGAVFGALSLRVYDPPFTSASAPAVTMLPRGFKHPRQLTWNDEDIWVADDEAGRIWKFSPPFHDDSQAAASNATVLQPAALAIDARSGTMYVGDIGGEGTCSTAPCHVYAIAPPYTGTAVATLSFRDSAPVALALDERGYLYAGFIGGQYNGKILIFSTPLTGNATPKYTLDARDSVETVALDAKQNVYAQVIHTGAVVVFDGPIDASASKPSRNLGCPVGSTCSLKNWAGLAFGP